MPRQFASDFPPPTGPGRRPEEDVAHRRALRLTFSFQGANVELMLMEAIEMIVPPSLDITKEPPGAEFWFEIRDARNTPLYRGVQRNPIDGWVEVQTDNPETPWAHLKSARKEGDFALLVPDLPEAQAIALNEWRMPEDATQRQLPPAPVEIARFPLGSAIDEHVIARDKIPPRTVSDAVAAYDGKATVHLRASDNLGQAADTFFRLDDGRDEQGLTVATDQPGEHTLRFWSVDLAGNVEPENQVTFWVGSATKTRGR